MGGQGSGRRSTRRRLVEECFALRAGDVARLVPGRVAVVELRAPLYAWQARAKVVLRLGVGGRTVTVDLPAAWGDLRTEAALRPAPVPSGGMRWYMLCPRCDGRVEILYWPLNVAAGLACRACHRLAYRSTRRRPGRPVWLERRFRELQPSGGAVL
jgi:hypothetical protein